MAGGDMLAGDSGGFGRGLGIVVAIDAAAAC